MQGYYLGIDVGSVSTNLVLTDESSQIVAELYLRSQGQTMKSVAAGLQELAQKQGVSEVLGVGVTGSGRKVIGTILGAEAIKNEITAHGLAAVKAEPSVRTVLEIGGQDSKLILLNRGVITDFAMNTVCAAGTGSFLDRQAQRLGIGVEEIGDYAARAENPTHIAGRCAVFAESDMIHKQQQGESRENILGGLCQALVRNYLANLAKGKKIREPVLFQGGVAANRGILAAFEKELGLTVQVPAHFAVMGAWGAAILAREAAGALPRPRRLSWEALEQEGRIETFICRDCANHCEIMQNIRDGQVLGCWGSRCGKYS